MASITRSKLLESSNINACAGFTLLGLRFITVHWHCLCSVFFGGYKCNKVVLRGDKFADMLFGSYKTLSWWVLVAAVLCCLSAVGICFGIQSCVFVSGGGMFGDMFWWLYDIV